MYFMLWPDITFIFPTNVYLSFCGPFIVLLCLLIMCFYVSELKPLLSLSFVLLFLRQRSLVTKQKEMLLFEKYQTLRFPIS